MPVFVIKNLFICFRIICQLFFERKFRMRNIFVVFVLILGIGGYVAENVHAEIVSKMIKTVVVHGPDAANLILEPTTENAVGIVGDGIGSYACGAGGAYVGAIVGTAICPGAGTVIGGVVGYWGGAFGGGYVGEKAAKKVYHQFR
ncbi:MAG: hypothetical protein LBU34_16630 [Planctomycetaceae bacterium]|jgi:hypothetical protein|nr:hypothetical protein [Planctomycetaceae bacterium]